ncbi:MAG: 50S ribosomal protein L22 [Candidatus Thermoplasmatota archaeon]|jgi:large subunit ribosomal protein L22|nr:50S ribosomal protein L22 [Candidatus Thermoplasmatota archaeon]MCL5984009.1 50S ribosomal protein L22 [Candidatus Thermoplasmatota archaeon]
MKGYTFAAKKSESVAKARGRELHISPKKAYEVMNAIRGLPLEDAKSLLEDVVELKRAIPFRRYNQETAHKRGIGPGRYPKKVAQQVLIVLQNAEANAEDEGLNVDDAYIKVAAASRGRLIKAIMPRAQGRSTPWNEETTNLEIILAEKGKS